MEAENKNDFTSKLTTVVICSGGAFVGFQDAMTSHKFWLFALSSLAAMAAIITFVSMFKRKK